jgi:hypothetical protein
MLVGCELAGIHRLDSEKLVSCRPTCHTPFGQTRKHFRENADKTKLLQGND